MLDLKNPKERKMYIEHHKKQLQRTINADNKTQQELFIESIKENKDIIQYIIDKNNIDKDIVKQIEEDLPKLLDKSINDILKHIKI